VGHVGSNFMKFLLEKRVKRIIACDIDPQRIHVAEKRFSKELYDGKVEFRLANRDNHSTLFEGKTCSKSLNFYLDYFDYIYA
jgi:ubiquinone/menaquinone biosynthesis C-methylase UbiE